MDEPYLADIEITDKPAEADAEAEEEKIDLGIGEAEGAGAVAETEREESQSPEAAKPKAKKKSKTPVQLKVVLLEGKDLVFEDTVSLRLMLAKQREGVNLFFSEQRKAATEAVVNPAHTETQTLETDFFSVYFYDNYERTHKGQTHRLKQKV